MDADRIAQLEDAVRECWGVMLLTTLLYPDDLKVQAAFKRAEKKCRATGLLPREGMRFIVPGE